MPTYPYKCPKNHTFELFEQMSLHRSTVPCEICKAPAFQVFAAPPVNGVQYSEETRKLLSAPFGKRRAATIRDGKDVERLLDGFHKKYPHLKRPDHP